MSFPSGSPRSSLQAGLVPAPSDGVGDSTGRQNQRHAANDRYGESVLSLCFVFVPVRARPRVGLVVFKPLAKRLMRLVLEEFAPAVKLAE